VGHLDETHVGALGNDSSMQVQQEVIGARLAASRMRQILTKARPLVDFKQYIRQVDVGYAPADLCVESLHTFREVLTLVHRHD